MIFRLKAFAALAIIGSLAILSAGCMANYLDPGPNPAQVVIDLEARPHPVNLPRNHAFYRPLLWDWGLYLIPGQGPYQALPPQDQKSLKAQAGDPLKRRTVFLVPPGEHTLELSAQSYLIVPWYRNRDIWPVDYYQKQWKLKLAAGERVILKVRFGPGPDYRPPPDLWKRQRDIYE